MVGRMLPEMSPVAGSDLLVDGWRVGQALESGTDGMFSPVVWC